MYKDFLWHSPWVGWWIWVWKQMEVQSSIRFGLKRRNSGSLVKATRAPISGKELRTNWKLTTKQPLSCFESWRHPQLSSMACVGIFHEIDHPAMAISPPHAPGPGRVPLRHLHQLAGPGRWHSTGGRSREFRTQGGERWKEGAGLRARREVDRNEGLMESAGISWHFCRDFWENCRGFYWLEVPFDRQVWGWRGNHFPLGKDMEIHGRFLFENDLEMVELSIFDSLVRGQGRINKQHWQPWLQVTYPPDIL